MHTLREHLGLIVRLGIAFAFVTFIWFMLSTVSPDLSFKNMFKPISLSATGTSTASLKDTDWLPAPKNYFKGPSSNAPDATTNLYVHGGTNNGRPQVSGETNNVKSQDYGEESIYVATPFGSSSQYNNIVYTNSGAMIKKKDGSLTSYFTSPSLTTTSTEIVTTVQPAEALKPDGDLRRLYLRNLSIFERGTISKNLKFVGEAREVMFDKNGKLPLVIIDNKGKIGVIGFAQATTNWAIPGWVRFEGTIQATLPKNVPCTLVFESGTIQPSTGKPLRFPLSVTCMN